ncbi:hypothetical protein [Pseudomonas sp. B392_1p]|uniref:hypothetical protein n=1 Tax=Pseudomonas sp. B392_1p TaxID=3457507 RepID=UPI003FD3B758
MVAKFLVNLDEAEYYGIDADEVSEGYWNLAHRQLTTALAITQQGIEFLIKGRICEISPYLLISDSPAKRPSPYDGDAIDFSKFRTIDAQDLIRVHDTFSPVAFDAEFVSKFNELRESRNVIMHSISESLDVQVAEVIESLLYMHGSLFPNESWANIRKKALESSPNTELGGVDYISNEVCRELSIIMSLLSPAKVKQHFKIDKKMRPYLCPDCYYEANHDAGDFDYKLARLTSKEEGCCEVYCPVCDREYDVVRESCSDEGECPGNVISETYGMCLTCGQH